MEKNIELQQQEIRERRRTEEAFPRDASSSFRIVPGCTAWKFMVSRMTRLSVVVDDLDIVGVPLLECEDQAPRPVDRHHPAFSLQPVELNRR